MASDEPKELTDAKRHLQEADEARMHLRRKWQVAERFLSGEHWLQFDPRTAVVREAVPGPDWRPRHVTNHVKRVYRFELGRLCATRPDIFASPASPDADDLMSAKWADRLIDHLQRKLLCDHVDAEFKAALITYGRGFLKVRWNQNAHVAVGDQPGEIEVKNISPWTVNVWPTYVPSIEQAREVFHTEGFDRDELKSKFGSKALKDNEKGGGGSPLAAAGRRFFDTITGRSRGSEDESRIVYVTERYMWPDEEHPDGQLMWFTANGIIEKSGLPYNHRKIPIISARYCLMPGAFWADGLLFDICELNARYNRRTSQLTEYVNRIIHSGILALPAGCGISKNQITGEPGMVLTYNHLDASGKTMKPEIIAMPQLNPEAWNEIRLIRQEIDDMASQQDVDYGRGPKNLESGVGVKALQEASVLPLNTTATEIENAWREVWEQAVGLAQQYYTEARVVRWNGDDGILQVAAGFRGSDIKPGVDIVVKGGSSVPRSAVARRQEIVDMVAAGIIMQPQAQKMLQLEGLFDADMDLQLDIAEANRENAQMQRGVEAVVHRWNNHPEHLHMHMRDQKMPAYEQLDPSIQQIYERHIDGHNLAMAMAMGQLPPGMMPGPQEAGLTEGGSMPEEMAPPPMDGGMPMESGDAVPVESAAPMDASQ